MIVPNGKIFEYLVGSSDKGFGHIKLRGKILNQGPKSKSGSRHLSRIMIVIEVVLIIFFHNIRNATAIVITICYLKPC